MTCVRISALHLSEAKWSEPQGEVHGVDCKAKNYNSTDISKFTGGNTYGY